MTRERTNLIIIPSSQLRMRHLSLVGLIRFSLLVFLYLFAAGLQYAFAQQFYIYDLNWDWSDSANPNSPWSYNEGGNALPHINSWLAGTGSFVSSQPAWARSASGSAYIPAWFKSVASPSFSADWRVGDIVVHTTDPGNGQNQGEANVTWRSPRDGTVDIYGAVWMGRDIGRGNNWAIYLKGQLLTSGHIESNDSFNRSFPCDFAYGSGGLGALEGISVAAGDVITLQISRTSPEGDFVGVDFTIFLTPPNTPPTISAISDQSVMRGQASGLIPFAIADSETSANNLIVSLKSSNTGLVLNENILLGGSGGSRNLSIFPVAGQTGTTRITITVSDEGGKTTSRDFLFTVNPESNNSTPSISPIGSQTTFRDRSIDSIPFTVADVETAASDLMVTARSSNPVLVPNSAIRVGGSGNQRTLAITPVLGQIGQATITVTVSDGAGSTVSESFVFEVVLDPASAPPALSDITNQIVFRNHTAGPIPFTIGDSDTPFEALRLIVTSSNPSLIPDAAITLTGSGSSRSLSIVPNRDQTGTAIITVAVSDGVSQVSDSFELKVDLPRPVISQISDIKARPGVASERVLFSVSDPEGSPTSLTVSTSDEVLIPVSNILFSGKGAEPFLVVVPNIGKSGQATIALTATNGEGLEGTESFNVVVEKQGTPPLVSMISDQAVYRNQSIQSLPFRISDLETTESRLTVSASSSNQGLVADSNIHIGGTGGDRTISIVPVRDRDGLTRITITVTDEDLQVAAVSFNLLVRPDQDPTISTIGPQMTFKNTMSQPIPFIVSDAETEISALSIYGNSDNQKLIPDAGIIVKDNGASKIVLITPAKDQLGTAQVTLTVRDANGNLASSHFTIVVNDIASKGDFDGDGIADIVFQNNNGSLAFWTMAKQKLKAAQFFSPDNVGDTNYQIVATGDFNRDGQEDLLFQHLDGSLAVWYMEKDHQIGASLLNPARVGEKGWRVAGVGDFNRDGQPDIILQHEDGTAAVWFMEGINLRSATLLNPPNPGDVRWRIVGVGDFDGDGSSDLVLQHADGSLGVWYLNEAKLIKAAMMDPPQLSDSLWQIVGVADWNVDGKLDLLFQHKDHTLAIWFMNGISATTAALLDPTNPGLSWKVVGPK